MSFVTASVWRARTDTACWTERILIRLPRVGLDQTVIVAYPGLSFITALSGIFLLRYRVQRTTYSAGCKTSNQKSEDGDW